VASKLQDRLNAVFTNGPLGEVQALHGSMGNRIRDLKTLVVHETSGFPPAINGRNMFVEHFAPTGDGVTSSLYVAGDGTVMQGMQLPNRTAHAGFVNDRSIGCETGHGWGNYEHESHLGPFTSTDETMIPDPAHPGHLKMSGALLAVPVVKASNFWRALSGNANFAVAADDDLPGIKFYVRVRSFDEVALSMWTTARYAGPWRQPQRAPEMLFNEPHYRSWALLARWIAEEFVLPRNFPVLPHKVRTPGEGASGNHGTLRDAATFSAIVLADEALARSPHTFGLPAAPAIPSAADLQTAYMTPAPGDTNQHWQSMFDVYRGFHGHAFCGDPVHGDHDCPGPMFDWHRFAREVWDWWWWPFDLDTATASTASAARPYSLATRDGDTPLKDYYWATPSTVPQGRERIGVHGPASSPLTFELPDGSRVYAVANGELVAARFPAESAQPSFAFVLVRHEVWHQLDVRPAAAGTATTVPIFANRIDYDVDPTTVYTLYMHLGRPAGMDFTTVSDANPDWLNRVLVRKKECDLGLQFKATDDAKPAGAADKIPAALWNHQPPSMPLTAPRTRPSLATAWQADQTALTTFLNALSAGDVATAPNAANTTPIRILLGDFIANVGIVSHGAAATKKGVRVEAFSTNLISATDFALTDTTATGNGWTQQVGVNTQAVRYASEWARALTAAELKCLQDAGMTDRSLLNWWGTVALATANARYPTDARLPTDGVVVHYELKSFMNWINVRTWHSEWPKYRATDPAGVPATPRPR
jgi:hypothetical protein